MLKILEATKEDIPSLIKLNNEVQELHRNWYPEIFKKLDSNELKQWFIEALGNINTKIHIAFIDSFPVGYLISKIINREENVFKYSSKCMDIDQIVISEKYRNKGIGKKILEEVTSYAKGLGIITISLSVLTKNSNAINAYTKMGFEPESIKMTLTLQD